MDYVDSLPGWSAVLTRGQPLQKYQDRSQCQPGLVYVGNHVRIVAPDGAVLEHHPKVFGSYNRDVVRWLVQRIDLSGQQEE